ncbi:MAG: tetratricopeptide repeat protein [Pseudomonadota bacterium]
MHEQSRLFSAPVLTALAVGLTSVAFAAEMVVRTDDQAGIVRTISSDDQQEIERQVESDLDADFQADLVEIVQDPSLSPLTSDTLRSTLFFRTADQADRPKFEAYVGGLLAKRKRHEEALSVLSALSPEQRIEHGSSFAYAQSYRGAGNVQAAINAYAVHITANPNHNPGYVNYGILLAETGQHEEAVRVFERSVDITSSSRKGKSLSLLGQSQMALGTYEEAVDSFDKSIQFRPNSGATWRRFATAKARAGTYPAKEIEADYVRALALAPDSAPTMRDWGEFNFSLGRFETALPLFRSASEIASNDFSVLFSRSVNLLASERPRAARQVIRQMANIELSTEQSLLLQALQEASGVIRPPTIETRDSTCTAPQPNEQQTYLCLLLSLATDEMATAITAAERLPATSIYTQPATFALARYEYRQGSPETASERLDVLLTNNPESPLFWLYKARALETSESNNEALAAYRSALELNPESRKITLELSDHLVRMEFFDEAEAILTGYSSVNADDASVLMALARVYEASGDPEKAEETLLQLMSVGDENDAEIIQQLVGVQVSLEKFEDALETADNLLEQDPANISVRELRVEALQALDRDAEAEEELDRIRRLTPESQETDTELAELTSVAP